MALLASSLFGNISNIKTKVQIFTHTHPDSKKIETETKALNQIIELERKIKESIETKKPYVKGEFDLNGAILLLEQAAKNPTSKENIDFLKSRFQSVFLTISDLEFKSKAAPVQSYVKTTSMSDDILQSRRELTTHIAALQKLLPKFEKPELLVKRQKLEQAIHSLEQALEQLNTIKT